MSTYTWELACEKDYLKNCRRRRSARTRFHPFWEKNRRFKQVPSFRSGPWSRPGEGVGRTAANWHGLLGDISGSCFNKREKGMRIHYQDNRVPGRDSDDICTRDGLWTDRLQRFLDSVQHVETSYGIVVGKSKLLGNKRSTIVQWQRRVATLSAESFFTLHVWITCSLI